MTPTQEAARAGSGDAGSLDRPSPDRPTRDRGRRSRRRGELRRKLAELAAGRELFVNLTLRELRSRYKRSLLGWTWSLLNPLSNVVIYTVVFSVILEVQPPTGDPSGLKSFPLFLLCALVPWTFFSNGVLTSIEALIQNGNLIKKVYCPRELFVMSVVASVAITMVIEVAVLCLIFLLVGNMVLPTVPVVLLLVFVESLLILGIGLALSVLNVFFRDVRYLIGILMSALFYSTPIVYPVSYVPERKVILGMDLPLRDLYLLNPLARMVEMYRDALYDIRLFDLESFAILFGSALVSLIVGWSIFERCQRRVAEEV